MNISKTHQKFVNDLQRIHNIPEQQVLNHPENYLGPNWEAIINFWIYLDTLTEEQLKVVNERYWALIKEERDKAWNTSRKAANETTKYAYNAGCAAFWIDSYAGLAARYATFELIDLEKLLAFVFKSMIISKTHQRFANRLQRICNIPRQQQVLNQPEKYLGPNWEAVINFWIYLDKLTEEQLKVVEKRYWALSDEERNKAKNKAYKASNETTCYAWDAGDAAHWSVSYAKWAAFFATYELIALEKLLVKGYELVFFPLFLNP